MVRPRMVANRVSSPSRLLALAWAIVLLVSIPFYAWQSALDHFVWHLVYGGSPGVVAGAVYYAYSGSVPRYWPIGALGGYTYMIIPDVLWLAPLLWGGEGYPHQPWMDVFLGHVFLDTWDYTTLFLAPTAILAGSVWYKVGR